RNCHSLSSGKDHGGRCPILPAFSSLKQDQPSLNRPSHGRSSRAFRLSASSTHASHNRAPSPSLVALTLHASHYRATFRKGRGDLLIVVLALVKPLSPPGDLSGQLICGPIEA